MTRLSISVDKWLESSGDPHGLPRVGVVANIYPVGAPAGLDPAKRRALRDLVVPFEARGGGGPHLEVAVDPGEYLVEATLPSGEVVGSSVRVQEGEVRPVLLQAPHSPHEWLSWHHLQGRLPRTRAAYEGQRGSARREREESLRFRVETTRATGPDTGAGVAAQPRINAEVLAVLVGEAPADSWRGILPDPSRLDAALSPWNIARARPAEIARKQRSHLAASAKDEDELTQHFLFSSHTPAIAGALSALHGILPGDWRRFVRLFAAARAGDGTDDCVAVLPVPWFTVAGSEVPVDFAVTFASTAQAGEAARRAQPLLAVRDEQFGTLLGYLGRGDLRSAATIFPAARSYLAGKLNNPFAAAAGAYVLMQTLEDAGKRRSDWSSWISNLMTLFEHIPDGAVLEGWMRLKGRGDDTQLEAARKCLLAAFARGIPYYTLGMRLLVDGLTLFANDAAEAGRRDDEVGSALEIARWFSMRADMKQPFTTLRLPPAS